MSAVSNHPPANLPAPRPSVRARVGRIFGRVAAGVGLVVTFVAALAFGVLLHLDTPSGRRVVVARINPVLASVLHGTLRIDGLERVGLHGAEGLSATMVDDEGVTVVRAGGLRARISVVDLVRSLLTKDEDLRVSVSDVELDWAEVSLDMRADGRTRLEAAFEPRPVTANGPARRVHVDLPSIDLKHAWVHGRPGPFPPLDADANGVHGSLHVAPEATRVEVARLSVTTRGMPGGLDLAGTGAAAVAVPGASGLPYSVQATFRGAVADAQATAQIAIDGPHLQGAIRATRGTASLDASGDVGWAGAPSGSVRLVAGGVDARDFVPSAPQTSLGAAARATFGVHGDTIAGAVDADVARGTVDATVLPQATVHGDYRVVLGAGTPEVTLEGRGRVLEQGAPTDVAFSFAPEGGSRVLAVDARAVVAQLGATRVGGAMTGRAEVHAVGRVRFPERALDARVSADVEGAAQGPVRLGHAHVEARATGPVEAPVFSTAIDATSLALGPVAFAAGSATTHGGPAAMNVTLKLTGAAHAPDVEAQGVLDTRRGVHVRDAHLTATRDAIKADVRVDELSVAGDDLRVERAIVEGLGAPLYVSARRGATSAEAHVRTTALDLASVGGVLGIPDWIRKGTLALDADLSASGRGRAAEGKLKLDLVHGAAFAAKDASAHLDATFSGRQLAMQGRAAEAGLGVVDVRDARVEIGGDERLGADSWKQAWGDVDVVADVDLARLLALEQVKAALPYPSVAGATGQLYAHATVSRAREPGAPPTFHAALETRGLTVGPSVGLDVQLGASLDGPSGDVALDGRVVDHKGVLLSLDAKASAVPYREIALSADPMDALVAVPFSARAVLPQRPFRAIPFIGVALGGDLAAAMAMQGTLRAPVVDVTAHVRGAKSSLAPVTSTIDADLAAGYAAGAGEASVKARTADGEVLVATAHLKAALADFLGPDAKEEPPWEASADAKLSKFPLVAVASLSDHQVHGQLSGEVAVDNLHADARAKAALRVEGLEIGTARFATARVDASVTGGAFQAAARLDQPGSFLDARAELGVAWGTRLVPEVDATKAALLTARAQAFPLAALGPLVGPAITDLSGKLDADARYAVAAGGKDTQASGKVSVRDVALQVTALGQEFHGVQGTLSLSNDGVLRLDDARALGTSGLVMAAGVARMNGLRMASARASVRVPKSRPIPIGVQGVQMGDAYGDLTIAAASSEGGDTTTIKVEVPTLRVRLPPSTPHAAQPLDEPKKVRVGTFHAGQFVTLPLDGEDLDEEAPASAKQTRVDILVHLGQDVTIERGRMLRVSLDGSPAIHVSDTVSMSGQIRLKSGTLEVQSKRFEIEKGTVSFVGDDPSNPEVVVTAGWTAADGTRVLADFVGPLKTGKVTLRSEPGRPQNEILALILFGTADGSAATPYAQPTADGATRAGTAAGGLATEGLSRGIDSLTGLDLETKVDTTDSANPRPEVELRIAKDISLQVAFVLGTPPPGANPDRTFATIDWRFLRNWSLAATFGDQGSSIADMIWRRRY